MDWSSIAREVLAVTAGLVIIGGTGYVVFKEAAREIDEEKKASPAPPAVVDRSIVVELRRYQR